MRWEKLVRLVATALWAAAWAGSGGCDSGGPTSTDGAVIGSVDASPEASGAMDVQAAAPDLLAIDGRPADIRRNADASNADANNVDASNVDAGGGVPGTYKTIGKGTFFMGSPVSEPCRGSDETRHEVTLTHDFAMSTTEVTQKQYQTIIGKNPAFFSSCGPNCPAERVSWHQAAAYCNALSAAKGLASCYYCVGAGNSMFCYVAVTYKTPGAIYKCPGYRLPTDAEWEYAYRAKTTSSAYSGAITSCSGAAVVADKIGWYAKNANSKTHPVRQKLANAWGLYDMAGNVAEWVHDRYKADLGSSATTNPSGPAAGTAYHVLRGGSWYGNAGELRAASRGSYSSSSSVHLVGFRCARTVFP